MKIDRLIGIITTLQQKGKVTASYLAEKFEVSVRTINRDIEEICLAGIPIVATRGVGGGIYIMEGYSLDTTIFTREELQTVLMGLHALESVDAGNRRKSALLRDKFGGRDDKLYLDNEVLIDLSSFYKGRLSEQIWLFRDAIVQKKRVQFHYFYGKGETDKIVDPYRVVFQWSNWYLFGYSEQRQDFRMYKLSRMCDWKVLEEGYESRDIPPEALDFNRYFTDDYIIKAVYESGEKYRLVEEYGPKCFTVQEDGRLYTEWGFANKENALSWFLQFGSKVQILEPEEFRLRYVEELKKTLMRYSG